MVGSGSNRVRSGSLKGIRAGTIDVEEELSETKVDRLFSSGGYCFRGLGDFE